MAWLSGYTYRKQLFVSSPTSAVANYQIKLQAAYDWDETDKTGILIPAGHVSAAYNDIRFTTSDGETLLDYWVESTTTTNTAAVIWVEFNSIGVTPTPFYVYYGNAAATSGSNGTNTFLFFDHFNDETVDAQWSTSGAPTETGTILTLNASAEGIISTSTYTYKRFRASVNIPSNSNTNYRNWFGFKGNLNQNADKSAIITPIGAAGTTMWRLSYYDAWEQTSDGTGYTDAYVTYQIDRRSASVDWWYNDVNVGTHFTEVPDTALNVVFFNGRTVNYKGPFTVDWVFISELINTEPTVLYVGEETQDTLSTFPTTLDADPVDMATGYIMSAAQWNTYLGGLYQLEHKIGTDGTSALSTLEWKLTSTSAVNPGHKHTAIYNSAGTMLLCGTSAGLIMHPNWRVGSYNWSWPASSTTGAIDSRLLTNGAGSLVWWPDKVVGATTVVVCCCGNTTLLGTPVNEMTFPINPSEMWYADYWILWDAGAASDIAVGLLGPSGWNVQWGGSNSLLDSDVATGSTPTGLKTSADCLCAGAAGVGSVQLMHLFAIVTAGSATTGNVCAAFSQAQTGTAKTSIYSGSCVIATRIT